MPCQVVPILAHQFSPNPVMVILIPGTTKQLPLEMPPKAIDFGCRKFPRQRDQVRITLFSNPSVPKLNPAGKLVHGQYWTPGSPCRFPRRLKSGLFSELLRSTIRTPVHDNIKCGRALAISPEDCVLPAPATKPAPSAGVKRDRSDFRVKHRRAGFSWDDREIATRSTVPFSFPLTTGKVEKAH